MEEKLFRHIEIPVKQLDTSTTHRITVTLSTSANFQGAIEVNNQIKLMFTDEVTDENAGPPERIRDWEILFVPSRKVFDIGMLDGKKFYGFVVTFAMNVFAVYAGQKTKGDDKKGEPRNKGLRS